MSNLLNLQRDMFHIPTLDDTEQSPFSSSETGIANSIKVTGNATVQSERAVCRTTKAAVSVTAGSWKGCGVYFEPPRTDDTPYRVKGYFTPGVEAYVFVGYGIASPTGTDDNVTNVNAFPIGDDGKFDEMILMPNLDSGHAKYGLPICFGFGVGNNSATDIVGMLSVQRLAQAPPPFASTVS